MSALGHKQTFRSAIVMSALPPIAGIYWRPSALVEFVSAALLGDKSAIN